MSETTTYTKKDKERDQNEVFELTNRDIPKQIEIVNQFIIRKDYPKANEAYSRLNVNVSQLKKVLKRLSNS